MIFDAEDLIVYVSAAITLEPGDVIATGTPSGVGMGRDPQRWLRDGDVCDVEIEGVGRAQQPRRRGGVALRYSALTAATSAFSDALASPNSIEQFGS